jgi:hypothetical protein
MCFHFWDILSPNRPRARQKEPNENHQFPGSKKTAKSLKNRGTAPFVIAFPLQRGIGEVWAPKAFGAVLSSVRQTFCLRVLAG